MTRKLDPMSSSVTPVADTSIGNRQGTSRRALLASGFLLALASCQVRPLYSDGPGLGIGSASDSGLRSALGSITVSAPDDRITQLVRNELVFLLRDDGATSSPLYRLDLSVRAVERDTAVNQGGSNPSVSLLVIADHQLTEIASNEQLADTSATAASVFETVEQRFANQRARLDAEQRAAREVAAIIVAQLSIALSGS